MATTSVPSGLGRVCGAVIRARTVAQGLFDIVVGERGLVLIPLNTTHTTTAAAVVTGRVHGGIIGRRRNAGYDTRRRENYLAQSADDLARQAFSHQIVRRQDIDSAEIWDQKLRLVLHDGTKVTLRWDGRANHEVDATRLIVDALGRKLVAVKSMRPASPPATKSAAKPAPNAAAKADAKPAPKADVKPPTNPAPNPAPGTTRDRANGRGPARGTAAA